MLQQWRASAQRSLFQPRAALAFALAASLASTAHAQEGRRLADPAGAARSAAPAAEPPRAGLARALGEPVAGEASPTARSGWALDVSVSTSIPLTVAVEAQLVTPVGLSAHLAVGHTPNAYLDAMTSILGDAGVYGASVEPLVSEGIANGAWNFRAGLGFTVPEGFEIGAGYTLLAASAELTPQAIEQAINQRLPWPAGSSVPLSLTLHALHARIGWRFLVEEHLVIRVALGWTHVVASSAEVEVPPELDTPGGPADRMEGAITSGLGRYGFTPELILSAGYRF